MKVVSKSKTISLWVEADDTIGTIKAMIQSKEAIPRKQQRLIFMGKELENDSTIAECNIVHGSTVELVPKNKQTQTQQKHAHKQKQNKKTSKTIGKTKEKIKKTKNNNKKTMFVNQCNHQQCNHQQCNHQQCNQSSTMQSTNKQTTQHKQTGT